MAYPASVERWRQLVAEFFKPEDVDKALYTIWLESGGDPSATNKTSGAEGLFQILPSHGVQGKDAETAVRWAANQVYNVRKNWGDWGEGVLYNGQPFGALGIHPYPGNQNTAAQTGAGGTTMTPEEQAILDAIAQAITGKPDAKWSDLKGTELIAGQAAAKKLGVKVEEPNKNLGDRIPVQGPDGKLHLMEYDPKTDAFTIDRGILTAAEAAKANHIEYDASGHALVFDSQQNFVRAEPRLDKKPGVESILGAATFANLYGHQAAQTQAVRPQAVSTQSQQGPGGTSGVLSQQELQNAIENEGIQVGEKMGTVPGRYTGLSDLPINYGGVYPGGGLQYMEGTGLSEGNTPQFKGFLPATEPGQNARSVGYSFRPNDILAAIGLRPGGVGVRGYSPNDTDTALNAMGAMTQTANGPGISWTDKKTGLKMSATLNELSQGLNPIGVPIKNRKQLLESLAESLGRSPTDFELEQMGAPAMAGGGGFTTGEPIGMIGLKTGKMYAVAGEDADNNGVPNAERITVEPLTAPYGPIGGGVKRFAQGTDDYGVAAGVVGTPAGNTGAPLPGVPTPAYGMSTQAYQQMVYDMVKRAAVGAGPLQRWLDDWVMRHDPTPHAINSGQHSGQGETYRKDIPEPEADLESVGTHPFMQQAIGGTNLAGVMGGMTQPTPPPVPVGKPPDILGQAYNALPAPIQEGIGQFQDWRSAHMGPTLYGGVPRPTYGGEKYKWALAGLEDPFTRWLEEMRIQRELSNMAMSGELPLSPSSGNPGAPAPSRPAAPSAMDILYGAPNFKPAIGSGLRR